MLTCHNVSKFHPEQWPAQPDDPVTRVSILAGLVPPKLVSHSHMTDRHILLRLLGATFSRLFSTSLCLPFYSSYSALCR